MVMQATSSLGGRRDRPRRSRPTPRVAIRSCSFTRLVPREPSPRSLPMTQHAHGASIAHGPLFVPPPNPFLVDTNVPAPSEGSSTAESTYVMLRSTGPVDASECEDARLEAVAVTEFWG